MNTVLLNTVHLDGAPIIKKVPGEGGGSTILNQSKSVEITENGSVSVTPDAGYTGLSKVNVNVDVPTQEISNQDKAIDIVENGTTEIVADSGYTGLGKVSVSVNVPSSGGGTDRPVIGDGKTYLYIKIAAEGRMKVPLSFSQTVANGVTIDWGDGSATQTLSGTGNRNTTHTYAEIGEYVISLDPVDGCTLGLGHNTSYNCVLGDTGNNGKVYCNMLQAVEIGRNVTSIGDSAFQDCYSLSSIVIPDGVTSIGDSAFRNCYTLSSIVIPDGVTSINNYTFSACYSLSSIVIPNSVTRIGTGAMGSCVVLTNIVIPQGVTSIGSNAFNMDYCIAFYDFSQATAVPTLTSTNALFVTSDCKIIVPDALYDEWIATTNWSTYESSIIKESDWDASQA